jgi:N-acetyl-anhydromuramyl-L-alanine amidase AmpD
MNKPDKIIVHHTGGSDANPLQDSSNFTIAQCNELHKERFNMKSSLGYYVGYHFYIEKNGKVTQTRAYTDEGAHVKGQNTRSIGVCMAGNFDATMPTKEQVESLKTTMLKVCADCKIAKDKVFPHRLYATKTCYGKNLSDTWARDLIVDTKPTITSAKLGDNGANIVAIQSILTKGDYVLAPLQAGVYDENMAQAVLYYQLKNNVAPVKELSGYRGESLGSRTITKFYA